MGNASGGGTYCHRCQELNIERKTMQRIKRFITIAVAPLMLIGGLMLTTGGAVASAAPVPPGSQLAAHPLGTPTGCPAPGYLCSYINGGDGQGSSSLCIVATGAVSDWGAYVVNGYNCHLHSGALVNTHTYGDVTLWTGTNGTGQEACIPYGSYYEYTAYLTYPNGSYLNNNINSSYQTDFGTCVGL